ncbi:glycosyltransferase family 2 protein [Endozoicomonas sp. SM1973]|uniref:Glycosyltransferase family 2 protein n=1 Tax=Spartinivicinus marinus TaxID=2994442 RepID=A0A853I4N4_9GAMM|nr:glycosyltransferase family 2 protein [Spartinivicinus marinus]MCX4028333.1 glycosyltransferase family 2 protein [Spartinivicinus marinus]NYZ65668.1 glycosyltransferase family 2 protein [Spartinivicinus marinus]
MYDYSIIMPAKNEAKSLDELIPKIINIASDINAEIIVVDDGSTDHTAEICHKYGINYIKNPYTKGNGASIKVGANEANGKYLIFMDADGQHDPDNIKLMLEVMKQGIDMVVGSRYKNSHANISRGFANKLYNILASWMVGHKISDLTSGFRVVNEYKFKQFINLLPNGFSYPTTITMAFYRAGYSVNYVPMSFHKRKGNSHINPFQDGIRFLLIIFKIGTLYSPLKIFFPLSIIHILLGFFYYIYTYFSFGTFTNMSALLVSNGLLIFLIGLVSEQITALIYSNK